MANPVTMGLNWHREKKQNLQNPPKQKQQRKTESEGETLQRIEEDSPKFCTGTVQVCG